MPLYSFICQKDNCNSRFEVLCKFSEIDKVCCTVCNSECVKQQITTPSVHFAMPQGSTKWDNFNYRAEYNMEKARKDRRNAEMLSHVGQTPYLDQERVDLGTKDLNTVEGKIV